MAKLVVQGDAAFLMRHRGDASKRGTGWVSVESDDEVQVHLTVPVDSTEAGDADAKRFCDELREGVAPAEVACETTWLVGMRIQVDMVVTEVQAALAERMASPDEP